MAAQRKGMPPWKGVTVFLLACSFTGVFGDVPDDVVYTDLHKTVRLGDSVVLKCQFRGTPLAVYWKKGDDPRTAPNLVSWVPGDPVTGLCEGERPCQIMQMNENFSLIIKEVSIAEQGRYICRVSSYKGILIHNFTDVKVYSPPQDPVPVIDQCAVMEPSTPQSCSISTSSPINITCLVSRYYPDLDLFFLHGHNKITDQVITEWTNLDGTKNKSISIKGSPSETSYVCVAWDIPGAKGQRVATILLRSPTVSPSVTTNESEVDSRSNPAKIVVPIIIIALAGGTLLVVYCWLKRRRSAPASRERDVEETQPMLQTIKVHVEGMVSYYELWSLAYNTPKEDMGKVCVVLRNLGMEISNEHTISEHVYDALCQWKEAAKPKEQAQMFRDALEDAELGNRWQQIYGERRQSTAKVSEGIFEQILLDLESPKKIKKFLNKLISQGETTGDIIIETDTIVPNTELNRHNAEEKSKLVSDAESNVGGEDDKRDDVSDAEKKKDGVEEAMRKLREWNKGPFSENPYVLVTLALERTGCTYVSRTLFDGIVSFYELRSFLYNMDTHDMKKLHSLIKELGEVEDVRSGLGPQQIYDAFCRWKEKHNKGDQAKLFRDALERADLSDAWLKIPETRQNIVRVSKGTMKHILLEIRDPIKIQQFIGKLIPGTLRHQNASDDKDVIQQAMDTLRKWSKGRFGENPMILLSRALERGGCNPVDRTFFYGTVTYFELWSLVDAYKEDMKTLRHAVRALGIQDVYSTKTLTHANRVYMLLCEWKNQHHACDQLLALKVLSFEAGLLKFCENLQERRYRRDANISDDTLEHILWHVKDPNKINDLLLELIQNFQEPGLDVSKPARDFVKAAFDELKQWAKGPGDVNPVVQLSLALERANCSPVDRTFFKLPPYLQAPISDGEVEVFVSKLTSRHCKRLANSLPKADGKRVLEITDENNEVLLDTKSMIKDWTTDVECSNYQKRCRLDAAVIKIGRHDMADTFRTIAYRRETAEELTQPHPASYCFNHDRIFDDDLIRLAKLMSCLDAEIMSPFCTSVGISDQVKEGDKQRSLEEVLREWRDSNLTSYSNGSLESVFSLITELMGDKTYVKYVTDEELGFIETQLKAVEKIDKLLSGLHIHRDKKKGMWIMKRKDTKQKEKISVSDRQTEKKGSANVESVLQEVQHEIGEERNGAGKEGNGAGKEGDGAGKEGGGAGKEGGGAGKEGDGAGKEGGGAGKEGGGAGKEGSGAGKEGSGAGKEVGGAGKERAEAGKEGDGAGKEGDEAGKEGDGAGKEGDGAGKDDDEGETYVPNVKDRGVESSLADLLKEWRNHCGEKSCRKKLRTVLKTMRMEDCIVNETPRKYMYKAELVQVAFNLLMSDVLPVIQALKIDQRKTKKYRRQNPDLEKGSLSLLIQLCQETTQKQAYNRRDFLPFLLKFGYVDAAKSLYLDYEQSLCELSGIVSRLEEKNKFQSFITQLGISPDELTECIRTNEEAYRIEVMRIWKSKIRPVPYHYRMHIATALQTIECWDLAVEVLSGHNRGSTANDDVIRAICSRLDREQTRRLCDLLKVEPDEEQKRATTRVVNWVYNWMDEYDPSPKVIKGKSLDKFLPRKHMNNELVKAGFYELANEIMRLEFSRV